MGAPERELVCQHWLIEGKVQGVGYRAWTAEQARRGGIAGWVRNLADGSVEAVVRGDPAVLATLHRSCLRGPAMARVRNIAVREQPLDSVSTGFTCR